MQKFRMVPIFDVILLVVVLYYIICPVFQNFLPEMWLYVTFIVSWMLFYFNFACKGLLLDSLRLWFFRLRT
jgi:hypothetical protein